MVLVFFLEYQVYEDNISVKTEDTRMMLVAKRKKRQHKACFYFSSFLTRALFPYLSKQ